VSQSATGKHPDPEDAPTAGKPGIEAVADSNPEEDLYPSLLSGPSWIGDTAGDSLAMSSGIDDGCMS